MPLHFGQGASLNFFRCGTLVLFIWVQGPCFVKGILQGALENGDHTRGTSYMFFPGCATGFHAPSCRRNIYNILQSVWNSAAWYFWNAAHVIQLMSSRVGKVVDSFLQTSVGRPQNDDIELLKKRHLMDCLFFPAHTAGISSTTAKQHKSWLAWIRCRLYIRFAVNYSSPIIRSKKAGQQ